MINWIEQESREHCHVVHCDYEENVLDNTGMALVVVVYFGGEDGSYREVYPIEDFFDMHEPERFHS